MSSSSPPVPSSPPPVDLPPNAAASERPPRIAILRRISNRGHPHSLITHDRLRIDIAANDDDMNTTCAVFASHVLSEYAFHVFVDPPRCVRSIGRRHRISFPHPDDRCRRRGTVSSRDTPRTRANASRMLLSSPGRSLHRMVMEWRRRQWRTVVANDVVDYQYHGIAHRRFRRRRPHAPGHRPLGHHSSPCHPPRIVIPAATTKNHRRHCQPYHDPLPPLPPPKPSPSHPKAVDVSRRISPPRVP